VVFLLVVLLSMERFSYSRAQVSVIQLALHIPCH
jgi:hypothetical protein